MSATLHAFKPRTRRGYGAYPYEVGTQPVPVNPPKIDVSVLFEECEKDELAASRGIAHAVVIVSTIVAVVILGAVML